MLSWIQTTLSALTVTDIVAIIGCVTGCISFAICAEQRFRQRFFLKVCSQQNYYFSPTVEKYESRCQAIINLQIHNKSADPVTVTYIDPFIGKYMLRWRILDDKELTIHPYDNDAECAKIGNLDKAQPIIPIRIDAYDAKELLLFFPDFPICESDYVPVKLKIGTTRGTKSRQILVRRATMRNISAPRNSQNIRRK